MNTKPNATLLIPIGVVMVPKSVGKFSSGEKFVVDTRENAVVRINSIGTNFSKWFLAGEGKVENPILGTELAYSQLIREIVDLPIIEELGGEVHAQTSLTELFELLSKQSCGEEGALDTRGDANIFYIEDTNNTLRAVHACWNDIGWDVRAYSIEGPLVWDSGARIFFRKQG